MTKLHRTINLIAEKQEAAISHPNVFYGVMVAIALISTFGTALALN